MRRSERWRRARRLLQPGLPETGRREKHQLPRSITNEFVKIGPGRAGHVEPLFRQLRGSGASFRNRIRGRSPELVADAISQLGALSALFLIYPRVPGSIVETNKDAGVRQTWSQGMMMVVMV